ncbi:MAG: arsenate reductase (glutaredoxin) [Woeseiaceae bacterium]
MALTIYHNPRCSKSRKTLQLIADAGIEPTVVLYLKIAPDAADILELAKWLELPVSGLLRKGESEFKEATDLPDLSDDPALARWLSAHPIVLQRPIVIDSDRDMAVIGRPPENVLELLG